MSFIKNILGLKRSIDLNHYQTIDGWLTGNEASGLSTIASLLPSDSSVLEIGSWKGKSTWCIAHGLKKGVINCIDPFDASGEPGSQEIYHKTKGEESLLDQFNKNLKGISSKVRINTMKGYSNEFVDRVNNLDFLFIDGDHSIEGCKFDFLNYAKDIKPGGYLGFHDYYPDRPDLGPTWVIENMVKPSQEYSVYQQFDSLMVFQKH